MSQHTAEYEELKTQYFGLIDEIDEVIVDYPANEVIAAIKWVLTKARKL